MMYMYAYVCTVHARIGIDFLYAKQQHTVQLVKSM